MDKSAKFLSKVVIDSGVALVSTRWNDTFNLMTVSFYAETSHVPPYVRVSIDKQTLTHELISKNSQFGISILHYSQQDLALYCGNHSGRQINKLEQLQCPYWIENDILLLTNSLATSCCYVVETIDLDTYTVFIAEIKESYRQSKFAMDRPLLISDLHNYMTTS